MTNEPEETWENNFQPILDEYPTMQELIWVIIINDILAQRRTREAEPDSLTPLVDALLKTNNLAICQ